MKKIQYTFRVIPLHELRKRRHKELEEAKEETADPTVTQDQSRAQRRTHTY